jgi:hypothetical protein
MTKEATSSSPSGRHVGHYKAILEDPTLVSLHATMMSLPFQHGFAPDRWTKVTDIMLEKDPGNARCHRLRIIALFESDFNQAKRILISRKLMHHLEDKNLLSEMQFGSRPGKQCQSAVLNKVLSHDITRLTRRPAAYMENDAIGCYDRLVNNLILLLLVKLGLPPSLAKCLGNLWDDTTHFIKTIYGTSDVTYGSSSSTPLFGPGQGSTCGPLFWLLCFTLIVDSMDPSIKASTLMSVSNHIIVNSIGVAFVDDSSLGATTDYLPDPDLTLQENETLEIQHLTTKIGCLAQHWERLLFSTGGAINLQKSHWYLMFFRWLKGIPVLCTKQLAPASLQLTSGYSSTPDTVPRIEVNEAFRTLGVYIAPNGSQTTQYNILRQYAVNYSSCIIHSTLTSDEAFLSYMIHLRPKLVYPLAVSSLTQLQCRSIQSPVMASLLPKLHLNRHTPHAVLYGEHLYGGLHLPDLYTDQGYSQLKLLFGHLKIAGDTGNLILIALSHTQLHIGSGHPVFHLQYPPYAKWIDHTWLTSIWKHLSQINLKLDIENAWLPQTVRQHDLILMDYFIHLNLTPSVLRQINNCRIHLQVITLADIVTADGTRITSQALAGERDDTRTSTLYWPIQLRPPDAAWYHWTNALQHLSTNGKLHTPLGPWTGQPHQQWTWYSHPTENILYHHDTKTSTWEEYLQAQPQPTARSTRRTRVLYHTSSTSFPSPNIATLVPTTIFHPQNHPGSFFSLPSPNKFPSPSPNTPNNSIWDQDEDLHILADTPAFFQRLIGPMPTFDAHEDTALAHSMELETLVACSDGSHNPKTGTGSHGWAFAQQDGNTLLQGAGPVDGHPTLMSSYRSELGGLLALLYLIHRICLSHQVTSGKVMIFCDNKGALANTFRPKTPSLTQFLTTDYDLLEEAHKLIAIIPITIVTEWVKGHYTGDKKEQKHVLNDTADRLATNFLSRPPRPFLPHCMPVAPPGYKVRILHDGSIITSKLYTIMSHSLHRESIISHILKKTKWTQRTFDLVNWEAHGKAFGKLTKAAQFATAKLIHNLANTNRQNNLYYNTTPDCPCCSLTEETFQHVLSCTSSYTVTHRAQALADLVTGLTTAQTPPAIIEAIRYGTIQWEKTSPGRVHAPTAGSLYHTDILVTAAFTEQYYTIGWYQLLLGRIGKKWENALQAHWKKDKKTVDYNVWSTQVVLLLWKYTRSLWGARNEYVHGKDAKEQAEIILRGLHTQVIQYYEQYRNNSNIVLPQHAYLFTSRTLEQRLRLTYDNLTCWLRSVEDAKQALAHHDLQLRNRSARFFAPFYTAGRRQALLNESDDSDYTQSSLASDMSTTLSPESPSITDTTVTYSMTATSTTPSSSTTITSTHHTHDTTASNFSTSTVPTIISWRTTSTYS